MEDYPLMTLQEIARYLKLSVHTIYKMVEQGRLPGIKLGKHWRFRKEEVYEWLTRKTTAAAKARHEKWRRKYNEVKKGP